MTNGGALQPDALWDAPAKSTTRSSGGLGQVCVGIATRGRPHVLAAVVENLRRQTLQPSAVILCCVDLTDVGALATATDVTVVREQPGLARQRNAILRQIADDTEFVVFFDDDFIAHPRWLEVVAQQFRDDPTIACITGTVIADGIKGPGIAVDMATRLLSESGTADRSILIEGYSPYGCNMAFRRSVIRGLWFDERLVLYGWLEDRDFGAAVAQRSGRLVKLGAAVGVHLGVKGGRVSGRKLGYSQVMNPAYMQRKNTMTTSDAVRQVFRNVVANLLGSLRPEPYIDRRGRLAGNLIAFLDVSRGRLTPERAERL